MQPECRGLHDRRHQHAVSTYGSVQSNGYNRVAVPEHVRIAVRSTALAGCRLSRSLCKRRYQSVDPLTLDTMAPELAERLRPTVARLGYLGDLFGIAARQPEILSANLDLAVAIRSKLDETALEVLVLTVSALTRNHYEQYQHEQLCARRGYGDAWIAECIACARGPIAIVDPLTAEQRVLRNLAYDTMRELGHDCAMVVRQTEAALGSKTTIAALNAIGYYLNVGLVANALSVPSPASPHLPPQPTGGSFEASPG